VANLQTPLAEVIKGGVSGPGTALVIGASGTLGGAIAKALAGKGFALGLQAFRHPDRLPALAGARAYTADLRQAEQIQKLAADFLKDFGRLDALVWAAGIVREAPVLTLGEDDLREVLAVGLTAPFLLAKAVSRQFLKQKSGSFVALSSHAGLSGRAGGAAYAMAQSGLLALVKSLAREWGPLGIRVNCVVPPFVADSELGRAATPEFAESVRRKSVYQGGADRSGRAVADFVVELIGNPTASGQTFVLDARI
jgi:NAD(P)-dependent dehydrogenase (short-subunit alcohol dehydrogenase family)